MGTEQDIEGARGKTTLTPNPEFATMLVGADRNGAGQANPESKDQQATTNLIDNSLRILLVGGLVYACVRIVMPFAFILLWSAILTVMLHPLHRRLSAAVGARLSALLIGVVGAALMLG